MTRCIQRTQTQTRGVGERQRELARANEFLGINNFDFLGLPDGSLSLRDVSRIEGRIFSALEARGYTDVVTFGQDGYTGHPDHVVTAIATKLAVQKLEGKVNLWQVQMSDSLRVGIGEYFIPIPEVSVHDRGISKIEFCGSVYERKLQAVSSYHSQLAHPAMQRFASALHREEHAEYYKKSARIS